MMQQMQQDNSINDINLQNQMEQPQDTVSSIQWIPQMNSNIFACGVWDGSIKIYDINNMNQLYQKIQFQGSEPILQIQWKNDATQIYAASENQIKIYDTNSGQSTIMGKHDDAITGLHTLDNNMLMSCSLDKTVKFWQNNQNTPVATVNFDHKIYISEYFQGVMALGLQNEKISIFDLQQLQMVQNNRWQLYLDNPTTTQINSLMMTKNQNDNSILMGIGSQDGRTNISTIGKNPQNNFYKLNHLMTFKCHKIEDQQKNVEVYPVSGIQGNSKNPKWLCTSGGEGKIIFWDIDVKNKIREFTYNYQPITKIKVSNNGNYLAYALGYDWSEGIWGLEKKLQPKIAVHQIQNNELRANA